MKKLTAALIICVFVLSGMAITVNAVNLGSYTGTVGTQYSKKWKKQYRHLLMGHVCMYQQVTTIKWAFIKRQFLVMVLRKYLQQDM